MADLAEGESIEIKGSAAKPYVVSNHGGVYSCTCPAWRNQGAPIDRRSCKHLRSLRGEEAEAARVGGAAAPKASVAAAPRRAVSAEVVQGRTEESGEGGATAPPILLAHSWDQESDLTGWWMSEKLDGVRAYWDGQRFLSRLGNPYFAPAWFVKGLPPFPLDGELWVGRKRFQRTVSIVRRQDGGSDWKEVRFLVFDAPHSLSQIDHPFEARLEAIQQHMDKERPEYATYHPHERCQGIPHLRQELARVESLGGEGLMLRKPGSRYEVGRSHTLLKVKSFHDAEAIVIGHQPGTGKHKGRLGALLCRMPDGTEFAIGTGFSDAERKNPPPIAAIVTYRYQELSDGGVPRFPTYVGIRHDYAWPGKT